MSIIRTMLLSFVCASPLLADDDGWVTIFDGKSFDGWKASENTGSWKVADGAFIAHGPRSHLFYVGDDVPFKNFEFKCDVMTLLSRSMTRSRQVVCTRL